MDITLIYFDFPFWRAEVSGLLFLWVGLSLTIEELIRGVSKSKIKWVFG